MKKTVFFFLISILPILALAGDDLPAYRIYNHKGKTTDFKEMVKQSAGAQVVFFGELHNNPISHWLEYELMKALYNQVDNNLILAAEMFEADDQLLLNEYIKGFIRKKDFEREAKIWPNHETDYAPLVDFASEHGIKFVASNIPRRYAAVVNLKGFQGLDSLNAYQRALIAPLPIKFDSTLPGYKALNEGFSGGPQMHQTMHLAEAQAIKDATMGWFLFKNLEEGFTILHFNGSYHSDNQEGIVWYLKDYARRFPFTVKTLTITCVEQENIDELAEENLGKADFIICIPSSMTKTY